MATPKYVPADVIGPLPGFGTGVKYIDAGNLAIAYEGAWGSARLTAAATALAMELADLAAAMDKYSRRTAWRCWARSQARALVGRLPGHTQPFIEVLSIEESAVLDATVTAPLVAFPARTSAWRSFVAGVGPSPPRFLSHRGASCPTNRSLPCDCAAYVSPAPNPTTMFGALVGGPNSVKPTAKGFYGHLDDRTSYETNEPALDYNAGWLITTMALAGSQIDQSALYPDTLSTHDREFPVSRASASVDADAWDACVDSGFGHFPVLPSAFVADVRNASERSIALSRFHPAGTGRLRTAGWQPAGLMLALVTAGVAAAYFLGHTLAAARAGSHRQLWFEGAVRVAAARDDARMLAVLRGLAEKEGGATPWPRGCTRALRFCPESTVRDGSGYTALLAGAAGATRDGGGAVEWLLAAGADPRAVKQDGWNDTSLHYAAATGSARAACALVAAAPGLATATNFAGRTPADVARDCGHTVLADWLNAAATATTDADAQMPPPPPVVALLKAATAAAAAVPLTEADLADAAAFAHRGYDGWGSYGVTPARGVTRFRVAAVAASAAWLGYLLWRALRTLEESPSSKFVYSVVFWLTEGGVWWCGGWWFAGWKQSAWLSLVSNPPHPPHLPPPNTAFGFIMWFPLVVALWRQIERKPRNLHRMLLPSAADDAYAHADDLALDTGLLGGKSSASTGNLAAVSAGPRAYGSAVSLASAAGASTLYPSAAIIIACYSEPVDVIQPTVLAALMQDYPPDRVRVVVSCDDPRRTDVPAMVAMLQRMRATTARALPRLDCLVRPKVAGVTHHAKAGNINSALFASGVAGDYIVVLDCDMVTDSRFLARTLGHFLERDPSSVGGHGTQPASPPPAKMSPPSALKPHPSAGSNNVGGSPMPVWRRKQRAGFLQTPQSFVNVDAADALAHRSRLFYGPLQAGRDGADAVCCCGTGCVFDRAALVSIGGQSYISITEDNATSQSLAASGFSSMYLDEKLQAGLAPDDVPGVFEQRLRWATGALQIWWRANPLRQPGMDATQRLLYYDTCAYPLLGVTTLVLCAVPIIYLVSVSRGWARFSSPVQRGTGEDGIGEACWRLGQQRGGAATFNLSSFRTPGSPPSRQQGGRNPVE